MISAMRDSERPKKTLLEIIKKITSEDLRDSTNHKHFITNFL